MILDLFVDVSNCRPCLPDYYSLLNGVLMKVVLSDDIFTILPETIEKTRVDITIFDGNVISQR